MTGPYALVVDDVITAVGDLPFQARTLDTNELLTNLPNRSIEDRERCGWFLVDTVTNPRPADTVSTTWSSGFVLVNGRPVEQWTEVAKTAKQIEGEQRGAKAATLEAEVRAAYDRLTQIVGYSAPTVTTNAQAQAELNKVTKAVQDMARMQRAVLRLVLGSDLLDAAKD